MEQWQKHRIFQSFTLKLRAKDIDHVDDLVENW